MDDNTRKKPRTIPARPAVRSRDGEVAVVSQVVSPSGQLSGQAAGSQISDTIEVIEGGGVKPGPNVKAYIERQLKSVYDDVLNQPIPDRFLDLLNGLGRKKEGGE
jgi:hypothetical protein